MPYRCNAIAPAGGATFAASIPRLVVESTCIDRPERKLVSVRSWLAMIPPGSIRADIPKPRFQLRPCRIKACGGNVGDAITDQQKNDCGEHALLLLLGAAHGRGRAFITRELNLHAPIAKTKIKDVRQTAVAAREFESAHSARFDPVAVLDLKIR